MVSEVRELRLASSLALDRRVGMGRAYPRPVEFMLDYAVQ